MQLQPPSEGGPQALRWVITSKPKIRNIDESMQDFRILMHCEQAGRIVKPLRKNGYRITYGVVFHFWVHAPMSSEKVLVEVDPYMYSQQDYLP